ncbi:MAG: hypothetical protein ACRDS0_27920 [Pseudonocardiaceae bacterium]
MTLTVLTVVVIALLIAALAFFLFRIGALLNSTADDLDDCVQNVKTISHQAKAIGPGVVRINETSTSVLGALPLLCDDADRIAAAKGAPYVDPSEAAPVATSAPAPAPAPSLVPSRGMGLLDGEERSGLGYMDA